MNNKLTSFMKKDGTRSVLSSLLSIVIGMAAGALVILLVGLFNPALGIKSAWEGIQLIFLGIFSTGRNAAGALSIQRAGSVANCPTLEEVLNVIEDLPRSGMTILIVTHDMGFAREISNRVLFIANGVITEEGTPEQIFVSPRHPTTAKFLSMVL